MSDGLQALWLSIELAAVTTAILLVVAAPLAWWLAERDTLAAGIVKAIVALPIVLPPTVIGFYLLILLGPTTAFGQWWVAATGETLTFSFSGLVIASCIYSLPFAVQPMLTAFQKLGRDAVEVAATLGAGPVDRFFSVVLPMSRAGVLNAAVLSFAHTIGEFGVVLMVGGNIPGETRVISIAIYDNVESLDYATAHKLSALLLALAFATLLGVYLLNRRRRQ